MNLKMESGIQEIESGIQEMKKKTFTFKSYLIEKNRNSQYTCPLAILKLEEKECASLCNQIRTELFSLFKEWTRHKELEYRIYLEDGRLLDLSKPLKDIIDLEKNRPDLYLAIDSFEVTEFLIDLDDRKRKERLWKEKDEEMQKKKDEEQKKKDEKQNKKDEEQKKKDAQEKQMINKELVLVDALRQDLKDAQTFQAVFGRYVEDIVAYRGLQFSYLNDFSNIELSKLEACRHFFNELQENHYVANESGNHEQASLIIEIGISVWKQARIQNEYTIRPTLQFVTPGEGIERKADCAIFQVSIRKIICLAEMTNSKDDLFACLRQNADQMRAFCLCHQRKKIGGIATNGVHWYFTNYEMTDNGYYDKFQVSKPFVVLKSKEDTGYYEMMEKESVDFFRFFVNFIRKNINDL